MIHQHVKRFERLERDINALTYVLLFFLGILVVRAILFIHGCQLDKLWTLVAPAVPLLSALLVARVANRALANGDITREDDRRQEIVRTTHHLIAISKDLKQRVGYVKAMLSDGNRPAFALTQIAETIVKRYDALLDRDAYKFLPGSCVDIISTMSGSIFGIDLLAEGVRQNTKDVPTVALSTVLQADTGMSVSAADVLLQNLEKLIEELFKLRDSIRSGEK